VREFVLQKVYLLRRPKTNVQILQQSSLLKNKYFVRFLRQHGQDVYQEVRSEYVTIVSRIYTSHFRTYLSAMEKLLLPAASQADTLGAQEGGGGPAVNMLNLFKKDGGARSSTEQVFQLGERGALLLDLDKAPVVPHMAEA
ncbi:uncharacterized protein HaLaN_19474, partial [Haematococcus lacustris]